MNAKTLTVPGISCDHCKMSIEEAVSGLPGVDKVEVDIAARTVDLKFDEAAVGLDQIIDVIEEVGYEVPR
ncbi:MAG TPA: copper ion binding protein [Acidimicrobiia bacterium]|nr:copper ion binding protein [Acidimicrobiia bacterium]